MLRGQHTGNRVHPPPPSPYREGLHWNGLSAPHLLRAGPVDAQQRVQVGVSDDEAVAVVVDRDAVRVVQ
jgi:hypothetical protein